MTRARGRPAGGETPVSQEQMLETALDLLDRKGAEGLTMRALADRLGVNPMTIHHHFGGRDGLISALSDRAYVRIAAPASGTPVARIRGLLRAYHAEVLRHPGLTLLIFSHPAVFPGQARRITAELTSLLAEAGLPEEAASRWLEILVDFTHGAALATAMGSRERSVARPAAPGYEAALDELLACHGG